MATSEYRRAADHRDEHLALVRHIGELRDLLLDDRVDEALTMALDLLTGLGSHISSSDRAFAQHANERRSKRAPGSGLS